VRLKQLPQYGDLRALPSGGLHEFAGLRDILSPVFGAAHPGDGDGNLTQGRYSSS
jgi:hypothetical protein